MDAVREAFPGPAPAETTLELNPGTTARESLAGFRDAGVDRVSVGVQSFDDTQLRRLGRAHDGAEVRRSLAACRRVFPRLSLDLIFAAPGQTLAGLRADLDEALDHAPDHVSAYELTLEPGTPFAAAAAAGRLARPAEEVAVAMMEEVEARLGAAGFAREFGGPPRRFYADRIEALVAGGLLAETPAGDLRLTAQGRLFSDGVFAEFV